MGHRKIEMKYFENNITRQVTLSKRPSDIFKKVDALARLCNVEAAVLMFPSAGRPYLFESPCPSSLKRARILKSQAKLDRLTEELERNKERGETLKKMLVETLEKYNMKKTKYPTNFEELAAFKEMLETLQDNLKSKLMEMEASSSLLMLSKNMKMKKSEPAEMDASSSLLMLSKNKKNI